MTDVQGSNFEGGTIQIDGHRFINCSFHSCTLSFGGTDLVSFENCRFDDTRWQFVGNGAYTMMFLQSLARSEILPGLWELIKLDLEGEHDATPTIPAETAREKAGTPRRRRQTPRKQ